MLHRGYLVAFLCAVVLGNLIAPTHADMSKKEEGEMEAAVQTAVLNNTVGVQEADAAKQAANIGFAVSVMLMLSVVFQMTLFYLVNNSDQDLKLFSWQVISDTISIFCAVLLFEGVNEVLEYYFHTDSAAVEVVIAYGQLLFWFFLRSFILAKAAGIGNFDRPHSIRDMELTTKFWGVLFGRMTAFASINAFGLAQQMEAFKQSALMSFLIVPLGGLGLGALFLTMNCVRHKLAEMDDGELDELETKWMAESEITENGIMGLSLSFLTVQSIRFAIGGVMPDKAGVEQDLIKKFDHGPAEFLGLLGVGLAFATCTVITVIIGSTHRAFKLLQSFCSLGFAWSMFYGTKWAFQYIHFTETESLLRVGLAMWLFFGSFAAIFILDKIADMDATGETTDTSIRTIITALGVLVGVSWKQCFGTAIGSITVKFEEYVGASPSVVCWGKLVFSSLLAALVLPAWRLYILHKVLDLMDQKSTGKSEKLVETDDFSDYDDEGDHDSYKS